jgi:hypothetical protein
MHYWADAGIPTSAFSIVIQPTIEVKMRKSLLSIVACMAFAFCSFASAATDNFKPTGFASPTAVAAQALPDNSGMPSTVAAASDTAPFPAIATVAGMQRIYEVGTVAAADSRSLAVKRFSIQADRGAEGRTQAA